MLEDFDAKAHRRLKFSCVLSEEHGLPKILTYIMIHLHGRDVAVERCQLGLRVYCSTRDDRRLLTDHFVAPSIH